LPLSEKVVLKDKAREFLAATGLKIEEFARLLPAFESAYHALYPVSQTAEGKTRQRLPGGGTKGTLRRFEDKVLFILVYQKTYPFKPCTACSLDSVSRRPIIGFTGCCPCCSAHWPI
jgi:hypothetical protein